MTSRGKRTGRSLIGPTDSVAIDEERRRTLARDYLTHIAEAKQYAPEAEAASAGCRARSLTAHKAGRRQPGYRCRWLELCIDQALPPVTELEDGLRNGVALAKLARTFTQVRRIYDEAQKEPLNLRHSDNFNAFVGACTKVGLPQVCQLRGIGARARQPWERPHTVRGHGMKLTACRLDMRVRTAATV